MTRNLLLTQLATTLPLVGLIWTVQLVQYPLFAEVGGSEFVRVHALHSLRISVLVVPLMFVELGAALLFVWKPPAVLIAAVDRGPLLAAIGLGLVGLAWLSTFALQVPQHEILAVNKDEFSIRLLVATNWVRTVAWTLRGGLLVWLVSRQ